LVSRVTKAVSDIVGGHVKRGNLALTLGGDHSLVSGALTSFCFVTELANQAMGTISGTLRSVKQPFGIIIFYQFLYSHYPDACVVWVDAHADINTAESTDSGKMHP